MPDLVTPFYSVSRWRAWRRERTKPASARLSSQRVKPGW